jgi:putative ABC transport system permease protein
MYYVSPEYFETVGTPILRGRSFDARDGEGAEVKLIVDDSFARRFFGEDDPVGRRVRFSPALGMVEIVGVVGPTFQWGVRQKPEPTLYVSGYAAPQYLRGLMVRTTGDPASRAAELRQAVERAEPRLPVGSIETVETRLENSLRSERLLSLLTSGFGLLALLLAAVGLYGVMSYRAARRTSEIGLRMAIGARAGDIVQMMLREASLFVGIGIAVGLLGAAAIGRLAAPLLYETQAFDWSSLAGAGAVLLAAALGASLIPSLRASRVSPLEALRDDG